MVKSNRKLLIAAAGLIMLLALAVAAEHNLGPKLAFYTFSYGGIGESPDIEILNYRYANPKVTGPADWGLASGHIAQGNGISGTMLVGDSLYVKWRVPSTGKVYEDTVDLKSRLPWSMDHKILHFSIKGPQLNIYLVEGDDSTQLHAIGAPDCPIKVYKDFKCTRIYPDHWANF